MKKYLIILLAAVYGNLSAQSVLTIHTPAELNVGDQMPDIELGSVINNYTGKTKFSEFKGKLVILDFWSTRCGTCIELMPHMGELQEEFGDSIQIFLVNPRETQEQIEKKFLRLNLKIPANLPSIVAANKLDTLFTTPLGHPHHVWIGPKGQILMRSSQFGTYKQKIKDFLAGKDIFSMKDDNTTPLFDKDTPYNQMLGDPLMPALQYGSFFTLHNNNYAALNGGYATNVIDSAYGTIRTTFVNREVLELYTSVLKDSIGKCKSKIIYSTKAYGSKIPYCLLFVSDTSRYTSFFSLLKNNIGYTDIEYIKSRFCYEQVTPLNMTEAKRQQYMLNDLNRFFGNLYGVEGVLEKRMMPCYIVIRTSNKDKLSTKSKGEDRNINEIIVNGEKQIQYLNCPLKDAINDSFIWLFPNDPYLTLPTEFILDETGVEKNIDIVLPSGSKKIKSIDDLRIVLKRYDLDIINDQREVDMLVIKENINTKE